MFPSLEFWSYIPAGIVALVFAGHAVFAAITYALQNSVRRT
jgi:hypothetical protein